MRDGTIGGWVLLTEGRLGVTAVCSSVRKLFEVERTGFGGVAGTTGLLMLRIFLRYMISNFFLFTRFCSLSFCFNRAQNGTYNAGINQVYSTYSE